VPELGRSPNSLIGLAQAVEGPRSTLVAAALSRQFLAQIPIAVNDSPLRAA
jgi:hypothetical protein